VVEALMGDMVAMAVTAEECGAVTGVEEWGYLTRRSSGLSYTTETLMLRVNPMSLFKNIHFFNL